jgi:hypothetical protein
MNRRLLVAIAITTAIPFYVAAGAASNEASRSSVPMSVASDKKHALESFVALPKFREEGLYRPPSEVARLKYEARVNALAKRLLAKLTPPPSKADVLNEFKPTLKEFEYEDSEDRDQLLRYIERIMDIFGIESSDGLLNKWRYGFDPNQTLEAQNADALAQMTASEKALASKLESVQGETALASMTQLLGPPSTNSAGTHIWWVGKDHSNVISLGSQGGAQIIIWLSTGRFSYARKL